MTIEQKLDWVLEQVRLQTLFANKENGNQLFDDVLKTELYDNVNRLTNNGLINDNEWDQMKRVLFEEYKLIEKLELIDQTRYILTVKGKMFVGFSTIKYREKMNSIFQTVIAICTATGTLGILIFEMYRNCKN